jgi:RNA polymerase sigma-70 factor (ECF subfamily)
MSVDAVHPPGFERAGPRGAGIPTSEELVRLLYHEHAAPLLRFVLSLNGGVRHDAEDVVQETLVRAWRHADRLDPQAGSLRPWLLTVARRLVIDQHRRRQARPPEVSDAALEHRPSEESVDKALSAIEVSELLDMLSGPHREVLVATYLRGKSVAEAAAELGIPPGTVKSRVYYALRALKLAAAERGLTQ